jgi:hypothetical protein
MPSLPDGDFAMPLKTQRLKRWNRRKNALLGERGDGFGALAQL